MSKNKVTNAMRIAKAAGIEFETIEYSTDEVGDNFGERIAELTGLPYSQCFKTIVAEGNEIIVVCIPVDKEADLKRLAQLSGSKKVEMIKTKELLALTGYIRGGVSPIGMKKKYRTFIDESCMEHDRITVSGGVCGISLKLTPQDLIKLTGAETGKIVKEC